MKSLMVISLFFFWFALCECVYDDCLNGNVNLLKLEINNTYDVKLCNNSFVLASELTLSFGIEFADNLLSSWWLPSGKEITEAVNGVSVAGKELQCYNDQITVNGVYTCRLSEVENLYLGIYRNTNNDLLIDIQVNMTAHDYYTPNISLEFACISRNYPPTSVTWKRDGNDIFPPGLQSSILTNNFSTSYINELVLLEYSVVSGMYSCMVTSISSMNNKHNTSSLYIAGPPIVKFVQLKKPDTIILNVTWNDDILLALTQDQLSYMIVYKSVMSSDVEYVSCGNQMFCEVGGLVYGTVYSLVITPEEVSHLFQPTSPLNISITEPEIDNVTVASIVTTNNHSVVTVEWIISSDVYVDTFTLNYTAMCDSIALMCMNNTVENITTNNITFSDWILGIDYEVLLWAENVIGSGQTVELYIEQEQKVPTVAPQGLVVNYINSSSINATWDLLSCCESSGEIPYYILSLACNGTELHNVTIDNETNVHVFGGLEPNTNYTIRVAAVNSVGTGPWSNPRRVNTSDVILSSQIITSTPTTGGSPTTDPTTYELSSLILAVIVVVGSVFLVLIIVIVGCGVIICYTARKSKSTRYIEEYDLGSESEQNNHVGLVNIQDEKCQLPYLIEFPTDTKATTGESVYFLVRVSGHPEPAWSWEYQGEPVTPVGSIQVFSDGTLILGNVKPENSGRYTFIVRNTAGTISRIVNLEVIDEDQEDKEENLRVEMARSLIIEHKPIPINALEKYVEMHHASDNEPFAFLFMSLQSFPHKLTNIALSNKQRNRYKNIIPYDDNIVKLEPLDEWNDFGHTYINASYIKGYNPSKKFIATQGPMADTICDFWRMVWQQKCHVIVTLCNKVEGNRIKCEEYWPQSTMQVVQHGPYIVKLLSEELYANFTIRNLEMLLTDGSQTLLRVKQFHFTTWPDHGVPDHGSPLVVFHQKVMTYYENTKGPIIVHCSAGVGRTGTFIALDAALDQLTNDGVVDIMEIINNMREQRMKMVQTSAQFIFLHDTLLENILCGSTLIPVGNLAEVMEKLARVDVHTDKTGFEIQFNLIQKVTPKLGKSKCHVGKQHLEKNRPNVPLPNDTKRVRLHGHSTDYINASFIDGYQQKRAFIVAQSPLPQTVADFWKMIIQYNCSTIVMLCDIAENSKVVCHRYWPMENSRSEVFHHFSVKLINEIKVSGSMVRRTLGMKDMNSGQCQTVVQFQVTNWLPDGQCANHQTVGELYKQVTDNQRRSGTGNNPVVIHCSDTITRSGMYCAAHNAIEQARLEQALDIFQAVKSLRLQRPGSVSTPENYQTIHDLVKIYLSTFDLYELQSLQ